MTVIRTRVGIASRAHWSSLGVRLSDSPYASTTLAVVCQAGGVLVVAAADVRSRAGQAGAYGLFWLGLAAIFLPAVWRAVDVSAHRVERMAISVSLGISLFLARVVYNPVGFAWSDEFAHDRSAQNLLATGHPFGVNPLLPIVAHYPGLALATDTLSRLTGLSVFTSAMILLAISRLLFVVCLFLLIEQLTESSRAAALGVLVYAGNPEFLYWDVQFAYESLALPLVVAILYLLVRRSAPPHDRLLTVTAVILIAAITVTHHVSTFYAIIVLLVWTTVALRRRRTDNLPLTQQTGNYPPITAAVIGVFLVGIYLAAVAPNTISYLGPVLSRAAHQGYTLLTTFHSSRQLFNNAGAGVATPAWERATSVAAVVVVVALIPFALRHVHRKKLPLLAKLLAWSTVLWIVLLPLRLTQYGQETANRSTEFTFLGAALALGVYLDQKFASRRARILAGFALVTIFGGGISIAFNYSQRMAPNMASTSAPTAPTPDDLAAATWLLKQFGPGHVVATDAVTRLSFGSVGRQNVVFGNTEATHTYHLFFDDSITDAAVQEIRSAHLEFVVLQMHLVNSLPIGDYTFDVGEPAVDSVKPVPTRDFAKFIGAPGFVPVYRSGSVAIFKIDPQQIVAT